MVKILLVIILVVSIQKISSKLFNKEKYLINKYLKSKNQEDGRKALLYLVKNSPFQKIKDFSKKGIDLNYIDKNGNTILIEVAKYKKAESAAAYDRKREPSFIQIWINDGADINIKNNQGNTALIEAAKHGNYYLTKLLIKNGADINTLPNDMALIFACEEENVDKAKSLIQKGANVNFKHNKALVFACENYTFPIIKLLIESGADVNAKYGYNEISPLFAAITGDIINTIKFKNIKNKKLEIIKYLISKGADINEDVPLCYDNHDIITGYSLLMHACNYNDVDVVKILLKNGAKVNTKNSRGTTALHRAKQTGNTELIELLKSYGAK